MAPTPGGFGAKTIFFLFGIAQKDGATHPVGYPGQPLISPVLLLGSGHRTGRDVAVPRRVLLRKEIAENTPFRRGVYFVASGPRNPFLRKVLAASSREGLLRPASTPADYPEKADLPEVDCITIRLWNHHVLNPSMGACRVLSKSRQTMAV
jgi:hypothetical protein